MCVITYNILLFASLTLNSNVLSVLGSNVFEERGGLFAFWKCRQIAVRDRHVMPLCEFGLSWDWISKLSGEQEQDHAFTSNYLCKRNKKIFFFNYCTNAAFIVVLIGRPTSNKELSSWTLPRYEAFEKIGWGFWLLGGLPLMENTFCKDRHPLLDLSEVLARHVMPLCCWN